MEENKIFNDLSVNLKELDTVEHDVSMVELAIYQKNLEELKYKKLDEINEYFKQKAIYYNQKVEDFQTEK